MALISFIQKPWQVTSGWMATNASLRAPSHRKCEREVMEQLSLHSDARDGCRSNDGSKFAGRMTLNRLVLRLNLQSAQLLDAVLHIGPIFRQLL